MYEINITLNGKHYFATAERSCPSITKAFDLIKDFRKVFPQELGFEITLSEVKHTHESIKIPEIGTK